MVDIWSLVIDYGKLESGYYDIIVLDIEGVVKYIFNEDGFGVLENLKVKNAV